MTEKDWKFWSVCRRFTDLGSATAQGSSSGRAVSGSIYRKVTGRSGKCVNVLESACHNHNYLPTNRLLPLYLEKRRAVV